MCKGSTKCTACALVGKSNSSFKNSSMKAKFKKGFSLLRTGGGVAVGLIAGEAVNKIDMVASNPWKTAAAKIALGGAACLLVKNSDLNNIGIGTLASGLKDAAMQILPPAVAAKIASPFNYGLGDGFNGTTVGENYDAMVSRSRY